MTDAVLVGAAVVGVTTVVVGAAVVGVAVVGTAVMGVAVVDDNVTVDFNSYEDKQSAPRPILLAVTVKSGLVLEPTSAWVPFVGWMRKTTCVPSRIIVCHAVYGGVLDIRKSNLEA